MLLLLGPSSDNPLPHGSFILFEQLTNQDCSLISWCWFFEVAVHKAGTFFESILGKKPEDRSAMEDGNDSDSASTTASSIDTTLSDETDRVDGQGKPFIC